MATFGAFGRVTAACAASSIAVPDFNAMSVQRASGLNMRKGFPAFGSISFLRDEQALTQAVCPPIR
jgi:hypothetical protein